MFKLRRENVSCWSLSLVDPEVLADVEQWKKNLANYSAQVVGKTLVFLNGTSEACRFQECNLGNIICDAMVSDQPLSFHEAGTSARFLHMQAWRTCSSQVITLQNLNISANV